MARPLKAHKIYAKILKNSAKPLVIIKKLLPLQSKRSRRHRRMRCASAAGSSASRQQPDPSPGGGMVDALVSGASAERRAGSSPVLGTHINRKRLIFSTYGFLMQFFVNHLSTELKISLDFTTSNRAESGWMNRI